MNHSTNIITQQIISLNQNHYTGILKIKSPIGKQWKLYFRLGRLVWSKSGFHPYRSFRRHLAKYYPQINLDQVFSIVKPLNSLEDYNYEIFKYLIQHSLIKPKQAQELIKSQIIEDIFDIFQQESIDKLYFDIEVTSDSRSNLESSLKTFPVLVNVEEVIEQARQEWLQWCEKGFKSFSPNLAPRLKQQAKLKQEVSEVVYQNLVKLIDGDRTLRDLAFTLNKDLLAVAHSLIRYIRRDFVELAEVGDKAPILNLTQSPGTIHTPQRELTDKNIPLIACIDDSSQICKIMKEIITQIGYRYVGIQDPLQILPILINCNPDLIFLDIGMPILNGYEVISQIRRVSKLQDTPVVMLTAQDGIFDRMRAKAEVLNAEI